MGWRQVEFPLLVITAGGGFTGLFVYGPGAPRSGNLLYSIAATQGTDPFGNPFFQGGCAYFGPAGGAAVAQMVGDNFALFSEVFPPLNKAGLIGVSAGAAFQAIVLTSGRISTDTPSNISLYSGTPGLLSGSPQVVINAAINGSNGGTVLPLEVVGGIASNPAAVGTAFQAQIRADTQARWIMDSNGKQSWGTGSAATDIDLRRSNPNQLEITGTLFCDASVQTLAGLQIFQGPGTTNVLTIGGLLAANNQFNIDANGKQTWGPGGATAVDTSLARTGAGQLALTGATANGTYLLTIQPSTTGVGGLDVLMGAAADFAISAGVIGDPAGDPRWVVLASGQHEWGSGAAAPDTSLFRASAGRLKTGGNFEVGANLLVDNILELTNLGSAPANLAGITEIIGSNNDLPFIVGANNTQGFIQAARASTTSHTVTATADTALSDTWSIPAASAAAQSVYEIEAFGHGTQGSTQQSPTMSILLGGVNIISFAFVNTDVAASAVFRWSMKVRLVIATTGAGGTCWGELDGQWGSANIDHNTGSWSTNPAAAINTTIANNFALGVRWNSATGAPTITCDANYFKKVA